MDTPRTTHHAPYGRADWLIVAALFACVLPLRLWLLHNTEVTARDSIGYIRYALQFEREPWQEVLKKNHQHPGYPALVLLMSMPVRAIAGEMTPANMELSCQLVSLIASLLLILPMYFLGRQFFERPVSFGATLLYQFLPISAQHLSDGISEPVFLLFLVCGLLQMVHAVRTPSAWRGGLCGISAGLAYLTRPEGALILPAFGAMLIAGQLRPAWRCEWRRFFECGVATAACALAVGAIFFITVGHFTTKPMGQQITGETQVSDVHPAFGSPLFATAVPITDSRTGALARSGWAICMEVNQSFHYVGAGFALVGLLLAFGSLRRDAGFWALAVFAALHAAVLVRLGMIAHYVSDRHVMILVLLGAYFAVYAMGELPRRLLAWRASMPPRFAPAAFALLLVGMIAACMPKAAQRLHGNRAENHAAGLWLAERFRLHPEDNPVIVDDHAWSNFFAGLVFQEGHEPAFPKDHPSKCYIVTTRTRDPQADAARAAVKMSADAKIVWPTDGDRERSRVVVWEQPRRFGEFPWPVPK